MRKLEATIRRLGREEHGGSMFEYAVMVGGIAVLAVLAVRAVGGPTRGSIQQSASAFTAALGGGSASEGAGSTSATASGGRPSTTPSASVAGGSSAPTSAGAPGSTGTQRAGGSGGSGGNGSTTASISVGS